MTPKEMLKPGYLVEFKNGKRAIYAETRSGDCGFCFVDDHQCLGIDRFAENLSCNTPGWDVQRIWDQSTVLWQALSLKDKYRDLVWMRQPEPKEMTLTEIEEALGYPVKVVKE